MIYETLHDELFILICGLTQIEINRCNWSEPTATQAVLKRQFALKWKLTIYIQEKLRTDSLSHRYHIGYGKMMHLKRI